MSRQETQSASHVFGHLSIESTSEIVEGKKLDTKLEINGKLLCWISGQEMDQFFEELNQVIEQYRI